MVRMDVRKGANAFVISGAILLAGVLFYILGLALVGLFSEDSIGRMVVQDLMIERSVMLMWWGVAWLALAFAGSFFEFHTHKLRMRTFMTGAVLLFGTVAMVMAIVFAGGNMLEQPWMAMFFAGGGAAILLISSTVFLYAARMRGEDINFVFRNRVGQALEED